MYLISIGIVSHGHQAEVKELLHSLDKFIEKEIKIEVLLVENDLKNPHHDLRGLTFPIKFIRNDKSVGLSKNINKIFSMVTSEFFCILNPDVVFVEYLFSGLIESMQKNEIDIIAPKVLDASGKIQESFRNLPSPFDLISRYFQGISNLEKVGKNNPEITEWLAGIFLLVRNDMFHKLSGYNENYFLYFEDVEFCTRARLKGNRIAIEKNLSVIHNAQRRSRTDVKHLYFHVRSALQFFTSKTYKDIKKFENRI